MDILDGRPIIITTDHFVGPGLRQEQFSLARVLLGPFYQRGLSPAWINNHTPGKVWSEITYPFPTFNGASVEVWEWSWISNFILHASPLCWIQIYTL